MFEAVDLYCERLGPGLWAEPVNAASNAAFLVGAWCAWSKTKRLRAFSPAVWVLLVLFCAIGLGSAAFHTVANGLTRWLDVLPILAFQLTYLWLYCRQVIGLRAAPTGALLIACLGAALVGGELPEVLNGSLFYAPAMVFVFVLGIYHAATRRNERYGLLAGALLFLVSLAARTSDGAVCPHFPLGTHFLWHLCNGLVVYLFLSAYLVNRPNRRRQPPPGARPR